ncbi:hypothetical protein V8057_001450 [Vibrio vulnificus]|nr:hypothetical protein [Vibrio vulnificus]
MGSVIKVLCGSFCSACLHPLTRRYVLMGNICNDQCIKILER